MRVDGAGPVGGAALAGGPAPAGGAAPAGGETSSGRAVRAGGAAPVDGAARVDGAVPVSGAAPALGQAPAGGTSFVGGTVRFGGVAPVDGAVRVDGVVPVDKAAPVAGAVTVGRVLSVHRAVRIGGMVTVDGVECVGGAVPVGGVKPVCGAPAGVVAPVGVAAASVGGSVTVGQAAPVGWARCFDVAATISGVQPVGGEAQVGGASPAGGVSPVGLEAPVGKAERVDAAASSRAEMPVSGAALVGGSATLSEAASAALVEAKTRLDEAYRARDVVVVAVVADRDERISMAWPSSVPDEMVPSSRRGDGGQASPPDAPVPEPQAAFFRRVGGHASTISLVHSHPLRMGMPPAQRSQFSTKNHRSLPRRPRRTFVRKTVVMQVMRMHADPPTPPPAHESDDDGVDFVNYQATDEDCPRPGGGLDEGVPEDQADAGDTSGDGVVGNGVVPADGVVDVRISMSVAVAGIPSGFGATAKRRAVSVPGSSRTYALYTNTNTSTSSSSQLSSGTDAGAPSVGVAGGALRPVNSVPTPLAASAAGNSRKHSAPAAASEGAGSSVSRYSAERATTSDDFAELLAFRMRKPSVIPAACWMPGAPAVLAAAQYSRTGPGRPSFPPVVRQGVVPVGVAAGTLPRHTSPSLPPPPAHHPAPERMLAPPMASSPDEESSRSAMNEDDLVVSNITPPASPAASPRATHPSEGSCRRSGGSRGTRGTRVAAAGTGTIAAAASAAVGVGEIGRQTAERDEILRVVRNGFP